MTVSCCLMVSATWLAPRSVAQAPDAPNPKATHGQIGPPVVLPAPESSGAPITLSLTEALARAQENSPQFEAAVVAVEMAHENHVQASAAMKPSLAFQMDYLNTQGNGISPVGRYVTNDGIHVYRTWAVVRQAMPGSFFINAGPRKAAYEEAIAKAGEEVAKRSLVVTVTQDYYFLLVAQHAYATAQESLADARHFLEISQALEQGGEVAHADVIRFELQVNQAQRNLGDAQLAVAQAKLNFGVLLFPSFNDNFSVLDDLGSPPQLPEFPRVEQLAKDRNPELAAAMAAYHSAGVDVAAAKSAFFPSLSVDFDYGIEANAFALHSDNLTRPGVLQSNLGYFATYSLSLPVWDWGKLRSQLHQAQDQKNLARLNLSFSQRQVLSHLYAYYGEAETARNQLTNLQRSVELAEQNLKLVSMQYKAGEATVLQVLDAQTSAADTRNTLAAGEARYRNSLAILQTLTGSF
ncbi:MAG TPA: TolC family protein [Candidatus Eisenbacteria bacterium]|nr:TolC family protein [Candidatus Eisenbacteria bacterium]